MRILVTGAGGVLGLGVVHTLLTNEVGIELYALVRSESDSLGLLRTQYKNLTIIQHDLLDPAPLSIERLDVIIHMASDSSVGPNLKRNELICRSMLLSQAVAKLASETSTKKLIYISSGATYEAVDSGSLSEESVLLQTESYLNAYGYGKLFSERLFEIFAKDFDFEFICFRLFSVYGPRLFRIRHYALSEMIRSACETGSIYVRERYARRAYLHEEDFARLMHFATCRKMEKQVYNIGGDSVYSMEELAKIIARSTGAKVFYHPSEKLNSRRFNYIPNTQLINQEFNLNTYNFESNLSRLIFDAESQ
jgi:nucleoside-diphosphate-sugar epimerase